MLVVEGDDLKTILADDRAFHSVHYVAYRNPGYVYQLTDKADRTVVAYFLGIGKTSVGSLYANQPENRSRSSLTTHPSFDYSFYQIILLQDRRRLDVVCGHIAFQSRKRETSQVITTTGRDVEVVDTETTDRNGIPASRVAVISRHQRSVIGAR